MSIIKMLLKEMDQEAAITRKMLSRVPNAQYDWKPHEKSMTVRRLATHIADISSWIAMALTTDELDFASNAHKEPVINNTDELMAYFEKCYEDGRADLAAAKEEQLVQSWTMRNAEQIYSVLSKGELIRISFSQIVHHRAQLGVFLRLLDIPIPGSYGPSADEDSF